MSADQMFATIFVESLLLILFIFVGYKMGEADNHHPTCKGQISSAVYVNGKQNVSPKQWFPANCVIHPANVVK